MSEVILDMAMSLDGFAADYDGHSLYPLDQIRGTNPVAKTNTAGAVIMDIDAYHSMEGNFADYPYQAPIFILTQDPPDYLAHGENKKLNFHFVTGGIHQAIRQSKAVAKGKNVVITGSIKSAQLAIEAGVVDLIKIRLINVIVGRGQRLFEHLSDQHIKLQTVSVDTFKNRTDLCFRLARYKYVSDETRNDPRINRVSI